jgi:heme exporter protein C
MNSALTIFTMITVFCVFYLVPQAQGLGSLVRIAFFHIPVAWVSVLAFLLSAWKACCYLRNRKLEDDVMSSRSAGLGLVFCLLATISGAVFAKLTWGAYWNWDPRQITIFILLLIYGAYFALRSSISEAEVRARLAAVYSLFSCAAMPFLVFVIPRYYFSLHPEPILNKSGSLQMDTTMLVILCLALIDVTWIFFKCLQAGKAAPDE